MQVSFATLTIVAIFLRTLRTELHVKKRNHKIHQILKKYYAQHCMWDEKPQNTQNTQKKHCMWRGNHKIYQILKKALRAALPAWEESTENTDHTEKGLPVEEKPQNTQNTQKKHCM